MHQLTLDAEGTGPDAAPTPEDQLIELVRRHEQPLFNYLLLMARDRDRAADCLQDTFLRAYEHLSRRKPVTVGWLYKVGRNRVIDHFRDARWDRLDPEAAEQIPAQGSDPRAPRVHQALDRLSSSDRELLYLSTLDGLTAKEIGELFGLTDTAVRMRAHRARQRFRDVYGDMETIDDDPR